jgi:hypothetical protein
MALKKINQVDFAKRCSNDGRQSFIKQGSAAIYARA